MSHQVHCTRCNYDGPSKTVTKGHLLIEIILWFCLFIPGLIYTIWRVSSRVQACPDCSSTELVPLQIWINRNPGYQVSSINLEPSFSLPKLSIAKIAGLAFASLVLFKIITTSPSTSTPDPDPQQNTSKAIEDAKPKQDKARKISSDSHTIEKKLSKKERQTIQELINQGFLKVEDRLNRAYISPNVWAGISFDAKKGLASALADYYHDTLGHGWVEIYDKMSGKKLAKYSSWGFSIE